MQRLWAQTFLQSLSKVRAVNQQKILRDRDLELHIKDIRHILPEREYRVLQMRLIDRIPLSAVGKKMKNISRERVRQIEERALERIKAIAANRAHKLNEL